MGREDSLWSLGKLLLRTRAFQDSILVFKFTLDIGLGKIVHEIFLRQYACCIDEQ